MMKFAVCRQIYHSKSLKNGFNVLTILCVIINFKIYMINIIFSGSIQGNASKCSFLAKDTIKYPYLDFCLHVFATVALFINFCAGYLLRII